MFRRTKTTMAPPTDGEVRIQKVDKIEVVHNILSKPKLYNPTAATRKYPTAGHQEVTGWKKIENPSRPRIVVSVEDINKRSEKYITEMKKRFLG
ncbi:unnamed protein product [Miscanthus lutarioriparius]|uniref:Uncharacterized protein n=1 Tax=Miscanthus lutarioriparius TaxID=422564 RepID=A0A811S032_9POAL|nr:unnamed protein product [Miscanthus lutarioriparius]